MLKRMIWKTYVWDESAGAWRSAHRPRPVAYLLITLAAFAGAVTTIGALTWK